MNNAKRQLVILLKVFGRVPCVLWDTLSDKEEKLLEEWSDKGLWEYGVSTRSGWITDKGRKELLDEEVI